MSLNILERINFGYDEFEALIIGLMAMNRNFMLIGRHGAGKTRLAKALSKGFGEGGYVFYDATKDDLISVAGIPDAEAIRNGVLKFTPHQRSIWDKSTIVVDEITRANRESQNLWLEILEERSCFGVPLAYRSLIATANPESYAAAFQLDDALLDRFYAVIPVPDLQDGLDAKQVERLLALTLMPVEHIDAAELSRVFSQIQGIHERKAKTEWMPKVTAYLSVFIPKLLNLSGSKGRFYISPRTYSRILPESILAVASCYELSGTPEALLRAAEDCVKYCLSSKFQIPLQSLLGIHESAKSALKSGMATEGEALRLGMQTLGTFEQRLDFLRREGSAILAKLASDELEKFLGELLRGASKKGEREKLVILMQELAKIGYKGETLRQLDGQLTLTLNTAINKAMPVINALKLGPKDGKAKKNIKVFQALVAEGRFIPSNSEELARLKSFLIDLYEGDAPSTEPELVRMFSELDFAEFNGDRD
ncbi:MAG: AAA family ATPase [Rectinemataceae bacterium]